MEYPRIVSDVMAELDVLLSAHAGGIEAVDLADDGVLHVRFTGMCLGCNLAPVTLAATVLPALEALDCIAGVEVEGGRISEEAQRRLRAHLRPSAARGEESSRDEVE